MECPAPFKDEGHYIWMWTCEDIFGAALYDFTEIFSVGEYRIENKINSLGIISCVYYRLPEPDPGTEYLYMAEIIFSLEIRMPPTLDENKIKIYIEFS